MYNLTHLMLAAEQTCQKNVSGWHHKHSLPPHAVISTCARLGRAGSWLAGLGLERASAPEAWQPLTLHRRPVGVDHVMVKVVHPQGIPPEEGGAEAGRLQNGAPCIQSALALITSPLLSPAIIPISSAS
eukprot:649973-Hanusia_phi.AAC.2